MQRFIDFSLNLGLQEVLAFVQPSDMYNAKIFTLTLTLLICSPTTSWVLPGLGSLSQALHTSTAATSLPSLPSNVFAPFLLPLQLSFSLLQPLNDLPPQPPITTEVYTILKSNYIRSSTLPPPPSNPSR